MIDEALHSKGAKDAMVLKWNFSFADLAVFA
jgi:hypothetical protein